MSVNECGIVLVGAGPIGLEMACELRRFSTVYRHFEAGSLASTIAWYAPGTHIFSSPERIAIGGFPFSTYPNGKATREEYLQYLTEVAHAANLRVECGRQVISGRRVSDGFELQIAASTCGVGGEKYCTTRASTHFETIQCKKVILAIGNMHLPNNIGVPGEELAHVSHFLGDVHTYYGRKVVIVGAKNSAAEAAVRLARLHVDVTVVCRGNGFEPHRVKPWLMPEISSMIKENRIKILGNSCVRAISNEAIECQGENGIEKVTAQCVLLLTGYVQDTSLLESLGVALHGSEKTPEIFMETMETNVPGLYLIGTASVGTERGHVTSFIETSHVHIPRVLKSLGINAKTPYLLAGREESLVES